MLHDVIEALRRKGPDALPLAQAEVASAPDSADAHHLLGLARREAGDAAGARASFERAVALAPDESLYHFSVALQAHAEGDLASADRSSARALALDPNQLGAYVLRVQLALAARDTAEATRQLALAERVAPQHPQLQSMAGQIALAKGDLQVAIGHLVSAAAASPQDAQVLALLAAAYVRQGHHAFAEQTLRKAVALDPASSELRHRLVETLLAQQRLDDADKELEQWRVLQPYDPFVPIVAAELRLRLGDPRAALATVRELLRKAPGHVPAIVMLERALNAIGDRSLARTVWEEVLAANPGFDPAWVSRLQVAEDADDQGDVLRRWREAIPQSAAAALNQARRDEAAARDADAEAGYDFTLALSPLQPDALFAKAMYEAARDPEAAVARLSLLIESASQGVARPALATRGRLHDRLGGVAEAVSDWRQAQLGLGLPPAPLPLPDEALAALPKPSGSPAGDTEVVLLWGPPGSGSERIAAALRHATSRPVMLATSLLVPRVIDFPDSLIARATNAAELPDFAQEVAAEYARSIARYTAQGSQGVFDWLARWDSRVVPLLRQALPRTRLLAILRDPRDLLLNWLAFGAPAGPAFTDPFTNAAWLANQLDHLLFSRDELGLPVHLLDIDAFDADPAGSMAGIAAFAGLPSTPDPQPAINRSEGPGRMPTLLPQGRWYAYRELLADAFDLLAPVAERLGYASV